MLSVIIPANNEENWLGACLDHLRCQTIDPASVGGTEIIVAANGCTDGTVAVAEAARRGLRAAGWELLVLDLPACGKIGALNQADARARGDLRAYLDADVLCSPDLFHQICAVLQTDAPRYASGRLQVAPARSWVSRAYARVWTRLPFMQSAAPGAGLFCVNGAGRARWADFPDIIADDGFARLNFAPEERLGVAAPYTWPLVEGFGRLVTVRRRQDAGNRELARLFPELVANEAKPKLGLGGHAALLAKMPLAYLVYVAVILTVRLGPGRNRGWDRAR